MSNPFTDLSVRNSPKRSPQTIPVRDVEAGTITTGAKANATPMQRVLSGAVPGFTGLRRRLLQQRNPTAAPLNVRTKTTSNRSGFMTLAPNSIAGHRVIGPFTGIAARGDSVGAAPDYAPNKPKPLRIRNNSLQRFGVSTIPVPVVSPPQGGGTPGFRALMARGKGHPAVIQNRGI